MRAPSTTAERWEALKGQDRDDGVLIHEILCDDGVVRYVVYINGTFGAENGNLTLLENAPAFLEFDTPTSDYIRDYMASKIPPGSDVMIHGYSQGGMYAQSIARDSPYNVTDVVTYGSPYITELNSEDGQNIIRIRDHDDTIPKVGLLEEGFNRTVNGLVDLGAKAADAWRAIFGDMDGAVQNELRRMERGTDLSVRTVVGGVDRDFFWGSHTDHRTYLYGSHLAELVASKSREGRKALKSMDRYNGIINSESHSDSLFSRGDGGPTILGGAAGRGFSGADVGQLLNMAKQLDLKSQVFNNIISQSSAALMMAAWTGADIDQIRSTWNRQSKPAMQRTAANLASLAIELRKQAEQQRAASGRK